MDTTVDRLMMFDFVGTLRDSFLKAPYIMKLNGKKDKYDITKYKVFIYDVESVRQGNISSRPTVGRILVAHNVKIRDTRNETSITLEGLQPAYSGPLPLKPAKLKDVKELSKKYVGLNKKWFYDTLNSNDDARILKISPMPNAIIINGFGQCGKCRAGTRRLNMNKYCKRDYAVLAKVLEREVIEDWARFNMAVQNVYKRGRDSGLRRGGLSLWIHSGDLACKCPKIRSNKSYLILGKEKDGDRPGLTITQRSIVIEWKEEWHNRMRRFQRRSKQCN